VLFISIALGYKMNVLMYIPAVLYITSLSRGTVAAILYIGLIIGFQIVIAIPFLLEHKLEYFQTAFNMARGFGINQSKNFGWIYNTKFFHNAFFYIALLFLHVVLLLVILNKRWLPQLDKNKRFNMKAILEKLYIYPFKLWPKFVEQDPYLVAEVFFACNFIGIVFARSIQRQFFVWYWYSIPLLLQRSIQQRKVSTDFAALILITLNFCYISYFQHNLSTLWVLGVHIWILK